jgi:hypothetical protein
MNEILQTALLKLQYETQHDTQRDNNISIIKY